MGNSLPCNFESKRQEETQPTHEQAISSVAYNGLKNMGNTCYMNSVLQALYHFKPFRTHCVEHKDDDTGLYSNLGRLYHKLDVYKGHAEEGIVPKTLLEDVTSKNALFGGGEHQDAHEFFVFLISTISEEVAKLGPTVPSDKVGWMEEMFEGTSVYQTHCLTCDSVTMRKESFMHLAVDIVDGLSLTGCIRKLVSSEMLKGKDKYFCQKCSTYREAVRTLKIYKYPTLLTIQLKRFKFVETNQGLEFIRLPYRVLLPMQIRLSAASKSDPNPLFELQAVVVHIGVTMNFGHYVACVRLDTGWYLFDDNNVSVLTDAQLQTFFEGLNETSGSKSGYLLFYRRIEE